MHAGLNQRTNRAKEPPTGSIATSRFEPTQSKLRADRITLWQLPSREVLAPETWARNRIDSPRRA